MENSIGKALDRSTVKALLAILILFTILPLLIMKLGSYSFIFFINSYDGNIVISYG